MNYVAPNGECTDPPVDLSGPDYQVGVNAYWNDDWETARRTLSRAIRLYPFSATAYDFRGRTWGKLERWDRALADYRNALQLDPTNAALLDRRGWALLKVGQLDEAINDFDEALRLDPS